MHFPEPQSVTFPSLFNQVEQRMVEKATSQKTVISLSHEVNERKIISSTRHFSRVRQREKKPCISGIRSYFSPICPLRVGPLVDPERAPKSWGFFLLGVQP